MLQIAPPADPMARSGQHFGGKIAGFTVTREALTADRDQTACVASAVSSRSWSIEDGSKPWPVQTRAQAGYRAPQDPSTWPKSRAPYSYRQVAKPMSTGRCRRCKRDGDNQWTIAGGWQMVAAPKIKATAQEIAKAGFDTKDWLAATVPGTALTTMIDRGVYPDPDYGLNNLVIPESLNKQDYWYRNEFKAPKTRSEDGGSR